MFDNDDLPWRTDDQDDYTQLDGPAVARISGRLARIDPIGTDGTEVLIWLIAEDHGYRDRDGEIRNGIYQAIKIKAKMIDLVGLHTECMTPEITVACIIHRGYQLWLSEILEVQDLDAELPPAKVPARDQPNPTDGKLIDPRELEKMAARGGYTALNHSVYRMPVAFHLVTIPKYRARAFEGREVEVQRILRSVAEAEGWTVVALAAEPDHCHVLLRGLTPKIRISDFVSRWKAITSRQLKMLPGLEAFRWAVGYSWSSVAGGQAGAAECERLVTEYILLQGVQGDQTGEPDGQEDADDAL